MTMKQTIKTNLTYHPEWDLSLPEKYAFQFHHQKLPNLEPNQIQISGIHLDEYEDFFMVTAFIRQSLEKSITFELLDLIVLDSDQNVIARETFDMEKFGELPAFGCRPWKFIFDEDSKLIEGPFPTENWSIVFELKQKEEELDHELDLDANWETTLSEEQKNHLLQLIENLPPVNQNEINFTGIQAARNESQDLIITLLIRNGNMKDISIEQLPLIVEDSSKEIIAKGLFKLEEFTVRANTSKPWTFIFPSSLLLNPNPELSRWSVYTPQ